MDGIARTRCLAVLLRLVLTMAVLLGAGCHAHDAIAVAALPITAPLIVTGVLPFAP